PHHGREEAQGDLRPCADHDSRKCSAPLALLRRHHRLHPGQREGLPAAPDHAALRPGDRCDRVAVLDRRTLLAGLAAGVGWPAAALAQPSKIARIGVVSAGGRPYVALLQGLREGLKALGLEDGTHYTLDVKETGGEIAAAERAGLDFERQG